MQWPLFGESIANDARQSPSREFVSKFVDIPYYLALWTEHLGYLTGKRVLDFGCGFGEVAAGVATFHDAAEVCGVDINTESRGLRQILQDNIGYVPPLPNLRFKEIRPGEALGDGTYDFVYTWSAMEHVHPSLMAGVIRGLHNALAPRGNILVQVAPLYYSSEGAHLGAFGIAAWEHLLWPHADLEAHVLNFPGMPAEARTHAWECYRTLNKITPDALVSAFVRGGFNLLKTYKTTLDTVPPEILAETHQMETLVTNQVVLLFERG